MKCTLRFLLFGKETCSLLGYCISTNWILEYRVGCTIHQIEYNDVPLCVYQDFWLHTLLKSTLIFQVVRSARCIYGESARFVWKTSYTLGSLFPGHAA